MKPLLILLHVCVCFLSDSCFKTNDDVVGCRDSKATNYNSSANKDCQNCCTYPPPPPKQGGVLFWSGDQLMFGACGVITVRLADGRQTQIGNFYQQPPVSCVNLVGGYMLLDVGVYTITTSFANPACTGGSGQITVKEGCNPIQLY